MSTDHQAFTGALSSLPPRAAVKQPASSGQPGAQKETSRYPLESLLPSRGFRPEIQGLRAFAVLLVVFYHVWFGRVSGGVDVFLFISAFLLSSSSIRKINEGRPLRLVKYWLHVFQRLLPVATVTIAGTVIASFFILPPSRWSGMLADAKASLFYYLNWHLAANSVDYYAQNAAAKTPFQHFWSLSIQGQIFILWPLLFALVAYMVQRLRWGLLPTVALVFNSVFVASLTFSIIETELNQGYAYFDTRTRLWEFAAGTLLAIVSVKWRAPERARVIMGWVGVVGLVTCGFLLPVQRAFPGFLALWPILSGAMVIMAGETSSKWGVDKLLSSKPLQGIGNISYALYLVHWPILILYSAATNQERVGFIDGTVIIVASMGLSWLLIRFVEDPIRYRKDPFVPWVMMKLRFKRIFAVNAWADQVAFIGAIFLIAGVPLAAAQAWLSYSNAEATAIAQEHVDTRAEQYPGARAIGTDRMTLVDSPIPTGDTKEQFESLKDKCDGIFTPGNEIIAKHCAARSVGDDSAPKMVFVGNSHAEQAISYYLRSADKLHVNMQSYLLASCRYPTQSTSATSECVEFNRMMTEELLRDKPATVVLVSTIAHPRTNEESVDPLLDDTVRQLTDAGIQVVGLRDNPRYDFNIFECAQKAGENLDSCARPKSEKYAEKNPADEVFARYEGAISVDLSDVYCPDDMCRPVVGNVYVYMDDNHVMKTYGYTMSKAVLERTVRGGWIPTGRVSFD